MKGIPSSLLLLAGLLALAACGQAASVRPPNEPAAPREPAATPTAAVRASAQAAAPTGEPAPTLAPAALQSETVREAVGDLAARLQVDPQTIAVVRVVEVEWPDGSLGCPQPDMQYTQALVNGMFIELRAGEQSYRYHSGGTRAPFLCISKDELLPEELPPGLGGPDV
jgi:predicted small lipoprotein YifL